MSYNSNATIYSADKSNYNRQSRRSHLLPQPSHQNRSSRYDHQYSDYGTECANCGFLNPPPDVDYGYLPQSREFGASLRQKDYSKGKKSRTGTTKYQQSDRWDTTLPDNQLRSHDWGFYYEPSEEYDQWLEEEAPQRFNSSLAIQPQNSGTYGSRSVGTQTTQTPKSSSKGSKSVGTQTQNLDYLFDHEFFRGSDMGLTSKSTRKLDDSAAKKKQLPKNELPTDSWYESEGEFGTQGENWEYPNWDIEEDENGCWYYPKSLFPDKTSEVRQTTAPSKGFDEPRVRKSNIPIVEQQKPIAQPSMANKSQPLETKEKPSKERTAKESEKDATKQ